MHSDFNDLLSTFNGHGVDYLVVGAHALAAHGLIRATKDLDVFVRPDDDNAPRVLRALAAFGAPLQDLSEQDLQTPGLIFQIGVPPVRIDVITAIDGVEFEDAWQSHVTAKFGDVEVPVLSRQHLITNKTKAGRKQDLADVEWLEKNGG
ncbi:MAG: nucleotidyltransferase [bacterium]|nr:nucleotidyltransferase [bacterium]